MVDKPDAEASPASGSLTRRQLVVGVAVASGSGLAGAQALAQSPGAPWISGVVHQVQGPTRMLLQSRSAEAAGLLQLELAPGAFGLREGKVALTAFPTGRRRLRSRRDRPGWCLPCDGAGGPVRPHVGPGWRPQRWRSAHRSGSGTTIRGVASCERYSAEPATDRSAASRSRGRRRSSSTRSPGWSVRRAPGLSHWPRRGAVSGRLAELALSAASPDL